LKTILFILLLIQPVIAYCQSGLGYLMEELPSDSICTNNIQSHSSILPAAWQVFNPSKDDLISTVKKKTSLGISPLFDLQADYREKVNYRIGAGIQATSSLGNKWYIRASYLQGMLNYDSLFLPRSYFNKNLTKYNTYGDWRGRISFTPNKIFNFQIGLDQNFIGEGCRSMFLSDYGRPYPFGMIRSRFWRIEYDVIYQFFREEFNEGWKQKNGATHYISFNIAKWLNIGVFETVVFQPKDTLLNRGYEVEYLNPVIFYRPQEYALGSSDNVLLGLSLHAKFKRHSFYTQFILDEFFLAEIKAKSGWWANKFGFQAGVKGHIKLGESNGFYRIELNSARPYTYAHLSSDQNYGNQGMTLSHPYGGNFAEILGEFKFQKSKWLFKLFIDYSLRGFDKNGFSYGGDIYKPYTFRPFEYGHQIGQGIGNNSLIVILTAGYNPFKKIKIQCFSELQIRYNSSSNFSQLIPLIGLRSQLWNDYRNY
jgi:hypothetical protein